MELPELPELAEPVERLRVTGSGAVSKSSNKLPSEDPELVPYKPVSPTDEPELERLVLARAPPGVRLVPVLGPELVREPYKPASPTDEPELERLVLARAPDEPVLERLALREGAAMTTSLATPPPPLELMTERFVLERAPVLERLVLERAPVLERDLVLERLVLERAPVLEPVSCQHGNQCWNEN